MQATPPQPQPQPQPFQATPDGMQMQAPGQQMPFMAPAPVASSRGPKILIAAAVALVVVLVAAGAGIMLLGQGKSVPDGTVQGRLMTSAGVAVSGDHLRLLLVVSGSGDSMETGKTDYQAVTDKDGRFAFTSVVAGAYLIADDDVSIPMSISLEELLSGTITTPIPWRDQLLLDKSGGQIQLDIATKGVDLGDVSRPS
jgi:hypothetical protein